MRSAKHASCVASGQGTAEQYQSPLRVHRENAGGGQGPTQFPPVRAARSAAWFAVSCTEMRCALIALVVAAGCRHKSGEHQSNVSLCNRDSSPVDPAFVDQIHAELRDQLAIAGFSACTRKAKAGFQLGARPVESYCGKLGTAEVLALINRPGERDCTLELDLRADVDGTEGEISTIETPIIKYRNLVRTWLTDRVEQTARPGQGTTVRSSGRWLGGDSLQSLL